MNSNIDNIRNLKQVKSTPSLRETRFPRAYIRVNSIDQRVENYQCLAQVEGYMATESH
jgi:hypothetical protein